MERDEVVPVTIVAPPDVTVVLDGCNPIELEQQVHGRWVATAPVACAGAPPPTTITRELTISLPPPGAGRWRAVVTWGHGCQEGRPLAFASCAHLDVVRSEPFNVGVSATAR